MFGCRFWVSSLMENKRKWANQSSKRCFPTYCWAWLLDWIGTRLWYWGWMARTLKSLSEAQVSNQKLLPYTHQLILPMPLWASAFWWAFSNSLSSMDCHPFLTHGYWKSLKLFIKIFSHIFLLFHKINLPCLDHSHTYIAHYPTYVCFLFWKMYLTCLDQTHADVAHNLTHMFLFWKMYLMCLDQSNTYIAHNLTCYWNQYPCIACQQIPFQTLFF